MRVEQNNFRDMFSVYLPARRRRSMCFVYPRRPGSRNGSGRRRMAESLPAAGFPVRDGGDVRIVLASGRVFIFPENPGT